MKDRDGKQIVAAPILYNKSSERWAAGLNGGKFNVDTPTELIKPQEEFVGETQMNSTGMLRPATGASTSYAHLKNSAR